MNLFEDSGNPSHVDWANSEVSNLFIFLRNEKIKMASAMMCAYEEIDLVSAWEEFDPIAYNALFTETGGDAELLYEPIVRNRILNRVMQRWPIAYYTRALKKAGIMDSVDSGDETSYFFSKGYRDRLKTV